MYLTALASIARRTGYPVVERPGWKKRGRGPMSGAKAVICHYTAGGARGNYPSMGVVQNGRPGLPGPLAHLGLGRDGTIYVIAAGRANHAGVVDMTSHSNSYAIGIEAENTGRGEKWSDRQMDAYAKLCRELCDYYKIPISQVRGHKEVARPRGRKPDPDFNMDRFRDMVRARKGTGGGGGGATSSGGFTTVGYGTPLRKGVQGDPVGDWQRFLKSKGYDLGKSGVDEKFGDTVDKHTRDWQKKNKLGVDGVVGPASWGLAKKQGLKSSASKPAPKKSSGLAVDGDFGPATKKALQRALKVTADGDIGPNTVKALQRRVGASVDGKWGSGTTKALQRKLKVTADGAFGPNTIKALQRALNEGKF